MLIHSHIPAFTLTFNRSCCTEDVYVGMGRRKTLCEPTITLGGGGILETSGVPDQERGHGFVRYRPNTITEQPWLRSGGTSLCACQSQQLRGTSPELRRCGLARCRILPTLWFRATRCCVKQQPTPAENSSSDTTILHNNIITLCMPAHSYIF